MAILCIAGVSGPARTDTAGLDDQRVNFYIDDEVAYFNAERLAEILVLHGAPAIVRHVPFGRATHLLETESPGCGFMVARELPGRDSFHWIAVTLRGDLVIATADPAVRKPSIGDFVASYGAKLLVDMLTQHHYQALVFRSNSQLAKLLDANRTPFVAYFEPGLEALQIELGRPLAIAERLRHLDLWLGCNAATSIQAVESISRAWKAGMASGEIPESYRAMKSLDFLPDQR